MVEAAFGDRSPRGVLHEIHIQLSGLIHTAEINAPYVAGLWRFHPKPFERQADLDGPTGLAPGCFDLDGFDVVVLLVLLHVMTETIGRNLNHDLL